MPVIKITGSNTSTGTLTLDDAGNTTTTRGSIVTWQIMPNSGVSAITNIYNDDSPGSVDVFDPDPSQVGGSTNWSGTINPNLSVPAYENYSIDWTDELGGTHTYDPRISVNS